LIKKLIDSSSFQEKYKIGENSFSRTRKLTFAKLILSMVRKSTKSIQNSLNEIQKEISKMFDIELETVTDSAYSQARKKLDFKAFEALSNEIKVAFYKDGEYKRYKGFRLTAFDGSAVNLPNNESIRAEFSTTERKNQYKDKNTKIVQGRISCFYDVLNKISLDSVLSDNKIGEVTIAKEHHLKHLTNEDLLICDRGYPSFEMFALIVFFYKSNFLVRLKKNSFKEVKILFDPNSKIDDMKFLINLTDITRIEEHREQTHKKAYTDGLTGVYNRNKFEEIFEYEVKQSKR